jgi:hypothetical protein
MDSGSFSFGVLGWVLSLNLIDYYLGSGSLELSRFIWCLRGVG